MRSEANNQRYDSPQPFAQPSETRDAFLADVMGLPGLRSNPGDNRFQGVQFTGRSVADTGFAAPQAPSEYQLMRTNGFAGLNLLNNAIGGQGQRGDMRLGSGQFMQNVGNGVPGLIASVIGGRQNAAYPNQNREFNSYAAQQGLYSPGLGPAQRDAGYAHGPQGGYGPGAQPMNTFRRPTEQGPAAYAPPQHYSQFAQRQEAPQPTGGGQPFNPFGPRRDAPQQPGGGQQFRPFAPGQEVSQPVGGAQPYRPFGPQQNPMAAVNQPPRDTGYYPPQPPQDNRYYPPQQNTIIAVNQPPRDTGYYPPQTQPQDNRFYPQPQTQPQDNRFYPQPQTQPQDNRFYPQPQTQPQDNRFYPQPQPGMDMNVGQGGGPMDGLKMAMMQKYMPQIMERYGPQITQYITPAVGQVVRDVGPQIVDRMLPQIMNDPDVMAMLPALMQNMANPGGPMTPQQDAVSDAMRDLMVARYLPQIKAEFGPQIQQIMQPAIQGIARDLGPQIAREMLPQILADPEVMQMLPELIRNATQNPGMMQNLLGGLRR